MNQKKKLSILEFSRLTGISRDNLRFYDRIGLSARSSGGRTTTAITPGTSSTPPI